MEDNKFVGMISLASKEEKNITAVEEADDDDAAAIDTIKVDQEADLNYFSEETGETFFHKAAIHWDSNMMDIVHEKFRNSCEHIPNISAQDENGRTPLHEAARVNNTEMVEWLLSHEVNIEERTFKEKQTPLHYAARFESIEVMEILLNEGADVEAKDYRSRTPLHLAINMHKNVSADYLLSFSPPPEVRIKDKDGNMAISAMIHSMPEVVLKALDQLHDVDTAHKTEHYILAYLEQDKRKDEAIKPPFDTAVLEKKRKVLVHPVMLTLTEVKWRFVRLYFYIHFVLYLLFLILWSVTLLHPTVQEQHIYKMPRDVWRIILQVVLLPLFILIAVEEFISFIINSVRHYKYIKKQVKRKEEDLRSLVLEEEEEAFLKSRIRVLDYVPPNCMVVSRLLTQISYLMTLIVIIMHIANVVEHTPNLATWVARIACCTTILLWLNLITFFRAIKYFGSLIAVISAIKTDIFRYLALASIVVIPYVICLWVMFGGPQSASLPSGSARKDLSTIFHVAVMTFRITLVDSYPYDQMRDLDEGMALILVAPFLLALAVIGLNLFIALLSYTFSKVQDDAFEYSILELDRVINLYEEKMLYHYIYNQYYKFIRKNCNPLVKKYKIMLDDVSLPKSKMPQTGSTEMNLANLVNSLNQSILLLQQELNEVRDNLGIARNVAHGSHRRQELSSISSSIPLYRTLSRTTRHHGSQAEKEWQRKLNAARVEI